MTTSNLAGSASSTSSSSIDNAGTLKLLHMLALQAALPVQGNQLAPPPLKPQKLTSLCSAACPAGGRSGGGAGRSGGGGASAAGSGAAWLQALALIASSNSLPVDVYV
jgi:hypothetical protein